MSLTAFSQYIITLVVKQELKILVKTKQAEFSPQIFPNWRLLLNRQKSQDIVLLRQCLMLYEPASDSVFTGFTIFEETRLRTASSSSAVFVVFGRKSQERLSQKKFPHFVSSLTK
jgi:hypothetical protein